MPETAELDLPPIDASALPPSPQTAVATAAAQALDLEKMDLRAIALSAYKPARDQAAEATKTLTGVVHDLSTQAKVDAAKSLRQRLINAPMADVRKLTKGIKSKLAAVSKTVGEEEEKVLAAFDAADALITPQIEAREAELEAERQARAQAEAERKAKHEANLARLAGAAERARTKGADSAEIAAGIEALRVFQVSEAWEEYRERGEAARLAALAELEKLHAEVKAREEQAAENERLRLLAEQQAAELERLRKAEAERLAAEQGEHDRLEAERIAELEAGAPKPQDAELVLAEAPLIVKNAHEGSVPADAPAVCASSEPEASNGSPSGEPGAAAQEVTRAADPVELWGVHVAGPDDIVAAQSREAAEARAEELNVWAAQKRLADHGIVFLATVVPWPYSAEAHAEDLRKCGLAPSIPTEYTEGQPPQQVLKAEPATADATDRGTAADASPGGGPTGAGQPAAAGPAGGVIIVAPDSGKEWEQALRGNGEPAPEGMPLIRGEVGRIDSGLRIIYAEPEPADPLDDAREFVALVLTAFNTKFPSQPKPSVEWWAQVRQAGEALRDKLGAC